ncbi:MAG: VOC family protein [Rhizobiales bacterium]|nr:VOC family protein [Hyphomicrobiales bacterium]MBI3671935.1 VOC family protein [Hyphomicrobiales bacterium]
MRKFQEGATMQVAVIVRDMEAALRRHWDQCRIGPWDIYTFAPGKVQNYIYRGKPANHTCLIAVAWSGDTQLELIQPLTGYSIYDEHLERHGEGLHHIKLYYSDCQKAIAGYAKRGYPVIQCGRFDEDEHYYLETEKDFGYIVELGNAGHIRSAERRYPPAEAGGGV